MTTSALRQEDFDFVVAPGVDGTASGKLHIDDGESITPASSTSLQMTFQKGTLKVTGTFGFATGVMALRVRFLGVDKAPTVVLVNDKPVKSSAYGYDAVHKVLDVIVGLPLTHDFSVQYI